MPIMRTLFFIFLLFALGGCQISYPSFHRVGEVFETPYGMAFIECDSNRYLDDIVAEDSKCVTPSSFEKPTRVVYVPKGTRFEVAMSFRHLILFNPFVTGSYYNLVVKDGRGNRADIEDCFLDMRLANPSLSGGDIDGQIAWLQNQFRGHGYFEKLLPDCSTESANMGRFIADFDLASDISIVTNPGTDVRSCRIIFKSLNAYLTYLRYWSDWNIKFKLAPYPS